MVEDEGEKNINERRLFHGTSPDVIGDICDEGFDWRLYGKNATAYGQGSFISRVPTSSGNHGKPGKLQKKFHAWKNHGI